MSAVGAICSVLAIVAIIYIMGVLLFFIIEILKDVEADRRWENERNNKKKTRKPETLDEYRRISRKHRSERGWDRHW
jgi:hypothetical protein